MDSRHKKSCKLKKVLILAYDFPPYVSVGGLRPYNWFKYFKQFDIEPVVVTRQWENKYGNELDYIAPSASKKVEIEKNEYGTIIRAPYFPNLANRLMLKYGDKKFRLIRKIISAYFELFQFVLPVGPKRTVYLAAKEYLKNNKVDVVIATGEPFVLFHYADKLSENFTIPWIADYRDPWSEGMSGAQNPIFKKWLRWHEKRLLKRTTFVTTVVDFVANKIRNINPEIPIHIFPNGYDQDLAAQAQDITQNNEVLTITYAGSVYDWHPLTLFCKAFFDFITQNPNFPIRLQLIGISKMDYYKEQILTAHQNLTKNISFIPRMSNAQLFQELAKSNALLLFNDYSIIGTKIFDYIAVKRKILFCFTNDSESLQLKKHFKSDESESTSFHPQQDMMLQLKAGIVVENSSDLLKHLNDLKTEFQQHKKISCSTSETSNYSRIKQVEKLAVLLTKR